MMTWVTGNSLTTRLTLLFAAVSTSVLLLLGLVIGSLVERHFEDMDLELLEGKLELIQHALAATRNTAELETIPAQLDAALIGHHGLAVGIWDGAGNPLYLSEGASFPKGNQPQGPAAQFPRTWTGADQHLYRGIIGTAPTGVPGGASTTVALSTDLTHHEHFMQSFRLTMWAVVALAATLSGFLGGIAARRGLAPLHDIVRYAADITAEKLDQRLEEGDIPLELAEVVRTLNGMLARLEDSFRRLSDFSSDLAHELRTPVSNLLTQTQVTLSKARTLDEYQDVLASNAEEFERLSRTIADMLFLAKADNNLLIPLREEVDLRAEVSSLLEYYEAYADEKQLQLSYSGGAAIAGDRLMLRRAIGNLLSNAVRHTPKRGRIAIELTETPEGETVVSVENTGETIAPEHLPRLFDRFYRADASRQHYGEGSGLGLAITRSIVQAHGGEVSVMSENGLTRFSIRFPR